MKESKFLDELQKRAGDQQTLLNNSYSSRVFQFVSKFLGHHPWRLLIPFSFLLSLSLYLIVGKPYVTFILKIFGGFH